MRTISYKCDKCGKPIQSRSATKMNVTIQRGADSIEKKPFDFCSPCFLKMKKAWNNILSGQWPDDMGVDKKAGGSKASDMLEKPIPHACQNQEPKEQEPVPEEPIARPETADKAPAKKRGRKPKVIDPSEWTGRTELFSGIIKPAEKAYILKLYVEDGLSAEDIAQKLHRVPKGINRAISAATKSGELDRLKAEHEKAKELRAQKTMDKGSDAGRGSGMWSRIKSTSYIKPAQTEVIDGEKYDVGGIMALHAAGWPSSKIAKEKYYDEDLVRVIIEKHM